MGIVSFNLKSSFSASSNFKTFKVRAIPDSKQSRRNSEKKFVKNDLNLICLENWKVHYCTWQKTFCTFFRLQERIQTFRTSIQHQLSKVCKNGFCSEEEILHFHSIQQLQTTSTRPLTWKNIFLLSTHSSTFLLGKFKCAHIDCRGHCMLAERRQWKYFLKYDYLKCEVSLGLEIFFSYCSQYSRLSDFDVISFRHSCHSHFSFHRKSSAIRRESSKTCSNECRKDNSLSPSNFFQLVNFIVWFSIIIHFFILCFQLNSPNRILLLHLSIICLALSLVYLWLLINNSIMLSIVSSVSTESATLPSITASTLVSWFNASASNSTTTTTSSVAVEATPTPSPDTIYDSFCCINDVFIHLLQPLSLWTISCINFDRYYAICSPLHYNTLFTTRKVSSINQKSIEKGRGRCAMAEKHVAEALKLDTRILMKFYRFSLNIVIVMKGKKLVLF